MVVAAGAKIASGMMARVVSPESRVRRAWNSPISLLSCSPPLKQPLMRWRQGRTFAHAKVNCAGNIEIEAPVSCRTSMVWVVMGGRGFSYRRCCVSSRTCCGQLTSGWVSSSSESLSYLLMIGLMSGYFGRCFCAVR